MEFWGYIIRKEYLENLTLTRRYGMFDKEGKTASNISKKLVYIAGRKRNGKDSKTTKIYK